MQSGCATACQAIFPQLSQESDDNQDCTSQLLVQLVLSLLLSICTTSKRRQNFISWYKGILYPCRFSPICLLSIGWQYILLCLWQSQLSLGCPNIIINNLPFGSHKCPSVSNKLYNCCGYPSFYSIWEGPVTLRYSHHPPSQKLVPFFFLTSIFQVNHQSVW